MLRHVLEQTKFDLVVMIDDGFLADPVERRRPAT
jgi:hypothetical protein